MANNKDLSAEGYEQAAEYQQHLKEVMASYDHPKGLLGEHMAERGVARLEKAQRRCDVRRLPLQLAVAQKLL